MRSSEEVLLLRRLATGLMDGHWSPPVGHLEFGEPLGLAACRECREETGIDVAPELLRPLALMRFEHGLHVSFQAHLQDPKTSSEVTMREPDRSDQVCWCPLGNLPHPQVPWLGLLARRLTAPDSFTHWLDDG